MAVAPAAEGAGHIFGDGAPAPFSKAALNDLRASMRGDIMVPGSEGYDQGRAGYELGVQQSLLRRWWLTSKT
jgi:hypothetical protein